MSNNELAKTKLEFISNKLFLNIINNNEIKLDVYNVLLGLYLLVNGFKTTGISEGGFVIKYNQQLAPINEKFLRPQNNFFYFTTKNSLIESNTINNSNITIKLKQENYIFKNTLDFKRFLILFYNENSKIVDLNYFNINIHRFKDISFKFNKKYLKKNSLNFYEKIYNQIFQNSKEIESIINKLYIEYIMENKTNIKDKIKIKI